MPVLLTKGLSIKVTDEDYASFEAAAGDRRVSAWARDVLLQAATTQPTEMILLVELLALRTIVVNLQFALAHGEPPTVEAMQRLIERADLEKFGRAQERLHAHHLQAPERRAGAHVPRGRVQQRPRQLLHGGRPGRRSVARPARRAVGTAGRGRRGALPAARGRAAPDHRRAPRPPSDGPPYTNARGERVKTMEHRAGWDATFSAPKSVSLTALVGGDERVREAHRASVAVALDEVGAVRPGAAGRQSSGRNDRAAGSPPGSSTTARGPSRVRRAPTPHARRLLQSHGRRRAARSVRCSRGSSTGRSSTGPPSIARSWPRASPASATRSSAARADSRRSAATRRRIWRPPVLAASRSRRTSSSTSATAPAPRRSPRTRRGKRSSTARTTRCSSAHREMAAGLRRSARARRPGGAGATSQLREDPSPRITAHDGRDVREGPEPGARGRRRRTRPAARRAHPIDG